MGSATPAGLWVPASVRHELARGRASELAAFERAAIGGGLARGQIVTQRLEHWVAAHVGQATDPRLVPFSALRAMGTHPVVYLAERTISGLIRRPNLYSVAHPDPRIQAETEEWLWPLLPALLNAAARAFAYGSVPVIFDWGCETLRPPNPTGSRTRTRRLAGHTHYVDCHEVGPHEVELEVESDRLRSVVYGGIAYAAERAHVFRWDPEFGSWQGQSARRRAWRDYCVSLVVDVLQSKYLERTVHAPWLAFAPPGSQNVGNGEETTASIVNRLLMALRGGGAVTLPDIRDAHGNRRYGLRPVEIPDRHEVWHKALGRYDGRIMLAYLVPPSLAGVDELGASAGKILDGMLREFVQDLAQWVADDLTRIVAVVHAKNHDPERVSPPEIHATDVGKASARKILLEVLRMTGAGGVAARVDVAQTLDRLGVPILDADREPPTDPDASRPPGRPRDMTGEREERREDARTDEGEDATGAREGPYVPT